MFSFLYCIFAIHIIRRGGKQENESRIMQSEKLSSLMTFFLFACILWNMKTTTYSEEPHSLTPTPIPSKNQKPKKKNKQNKFTFMGMLFVEKISTSNIASFTSRGAHGKIKWDNSTQKTHISIQSNILLMYRFIHAVRISQVVFQ